MTAPLDLSNIPQDTCPLCRQRTLTFSENTLRCNNCGSVAEMDAQTHRIRYITTSEQFADLVDNLKQNWLSRRQLFELTTRPLPSVVFLPIILSLLALCVLLGVVASVLAIRPSLMTTRNLIESAYSQTITPTTQLLITETLPALMSPVAEITVTTAITDPAPELTSTLIVSVETPQPTPVVSENLPTTPPEIATTPTPQTNRATPTQLPATNTAVPTTATRVIALTPTTLGQSSPIATLSQAPNPLTVTLTATAPISAPVATSTITAALDLTPSPSPSPTLTPGVSPSVTVIFSGTFPSGTVGRSILLSNFIQISDVKIKGDPSFKEGDEYIDLLNSNTTQTVSMSLWRIRVNGVAEHYIPGNASASQSFTLLPGQGCRIYTGSVNTQQVPAPYNYCSAQSFFVTSSSIGLYTNDHGSIDILDENNKVVASFTY